VSVRISAKSEYACLAVLALALRGGDTAPLRIREISDAYGIPERYLVQILLQLKRAGIVSSTRGSGGGYRLARKATAISLSEILKAIDASETTLRDSDAEAGVGAAVLASVWEDVRAAELSVLDRTTIAQLAERCAAQEWVI
jgi:Rrf2 family cysteine metabolism transcriptional repressor